MKKSFWSRFAALLFCLAFAVCSFPISGVAADIEASKLPGYQVISEREWQLSPGVMESEIVLNNAAGTKRQVTHVVEIDVTNPYTKVIPSYYKMAEGLAGEDYRTQIMSEQAKYAEENGYGNVVAAMNTCLHWYDTEYYEQHPELIGEPLGTLILDGELYRNSQNSYFGAYTCIVINFDEKNGQPRPDSIPKVQVRQTYDAITGWEEQLIPASFHFLVKDGVNQHSVNDPEPAAPRTMMGVKADGTLVLVMVEGRQAPFSTGFNAYEMAEYMISLGCVQAINCDGGGSSTFLSERPGEDLELHCSPSDGAERPVAHGVLVISTLPASHEHTPGEATDKAPTSTEPGYAGRTFCTVCGAIVEEGTELPTVGHTYSVDLANKKIVCDCGCIFDKTGLQAIDGKNYYTVGGKLASGWITVGDEWYCFDSQTFEGLNGTHYNDWAVPFDFENGRLTDGTWAKTKNGTRYWYGPGYCKDSSSDINSAKPYEIHGKIYLFDRNGYVKTGIAKFYDSEKSGYVYYDCGENGTAVLLMGAYNGYFYLNGIQQKAYRLIQNTDGDYYFISDGHKLAQNCTIYLSSRFVNGHKYADGTALTEGYYTFDSTGKMVIKNGVIDGYMYINGTRVNTYCLVKYDGNYYFVSDGRKVAVNETLYLSDRFVVGHTYDDGTPLKAGNYTFDAEGKMVIKNGVIDGYLYVNGVQQKAYKMVNYDGNYYFVSDGHKVAVNTTIYLASKYVSGCTYADGNAMTAGYFTFDAEGKMVVNKNGSNSNAQNGVINGYLYVDNVKQTAYKLVKYDGSYYFINDGHKIAAGITIYLSDRFVSGHTYEDGTPLKAGNYTFGIEGKMVIKNGVIDGYLYMNGTRVNAYCLAKYNGNYYFVNDGHKVAVNTTLYLSDRFVTGHTYEDGTPLTAGYYTFDSEGKMVIKNGVIDGYMYINNERVNRYALIEWNGDFYYVGDYRKVVTNNKQWLTLADVAGKTWPDGCMIEVGYHYFDETGKMVY